MQLTLFFPLPPILFSSFIPNFLFWPFTYCNLPLCLLQIDRLEVSGLGQTPLAVSCGADGSFPGGEDATPDPQRTKQAIAQLQQKILKLTEQIKIEQTARDDNVAEYLKLANNADKQQSTRIKQVNEEPLHSKNLFVFIEESNCLLFLGWKFLCNNTKTCSSSFFVEKKLTLKWGH